MSFPSFSRLGLSLLELQVAIVVLALSVSGTAAILVTELRQLGWVESKRQLYSCVPNSYTQAVFTELSSEYQPTPASYRVFVQSYSVWPASVTAVITLGAR